MVRVEASRLPKGFADLVCQQTESLEEALLFSGLHDVLCQPGETDFELLTPDGFILEMEWDSTEEVAGFRAAAEVALNALGADWRMAEFDEEDTMSQAKTSRQMGAWD